MARTLLSSSYQASIAEGAEVVAWYTYTGDGEVEFGICSAEESREIDISLWWVTAPLLRSIIEAATAALDEISVQRGPTKEWCERYNEIANAWQGI